MNSEKDIVELASWGSNLGKLWHENRLPKTALENIPPEHWKKCVEFLQQYPRAESLLTRWGNTREWQSWMLSVLSIFCKTKIDPSVPDIEWG